MPIDIEVKGAKELERKLKKFPAKVAKKVIRKSLRAGSKIILAKTKSMAPKDSGALKKSMVIRAGKRNRRGTIGILQLFNTAKYPQLITTSKSGKRAFYPAAIEYGRAAPGDAGGPKVVAGKSFIRQGFKRGAPAAEKTVLEDIKKGIQIAWKSKSTV